MQTVFLCFGDGPGGGGGGDGTSGDYSFPPPSGGDASNLEVLNALFNNYPDFQVYYNNMTESERALTLTLPLQSLIVYFNSKASQQAGIVCPTITQTDDIADAFRHSYWNALNTLEIGLSMAEMFANAHEERPNNNGLPRQMDLYNSNVGRNTMTYLLSINPSITASAILIYIKDQVIAGNMIMIENGLLVLHIYKLHMKYLFIILLWINSDCQVLNKDDQFRKFIISYLSKGNTGILPVSKFNAKNWNKLYIIGPYSYERTFDNTLLKYKSEIINTGIQDRDDISILMLFKDQELVDLTSFNLKEAGFDHARKYTSNKKLLFIIKMKQYLNTKKHGMALENSL